MSQDPNMILDNLRENERSKLTTVLNPDETRWLIAQIKHRDDQLAALRKLAKPPPAAVSSAPTETICQEADRLVSHDRQAQYGAPSEDFARTAAMWEPILGLPPGAISPEKVAYCMIAVKLSRLCHGYKRDSVVDIAGYAKTISMVCEEA